MDATNPVLVPTRQTVGPLVRAAALVLALVLTACVPVVPAPAEPEEVPLVVPMLPPSMRVPLVLA